LLLFDDGELLIATQSKNGWIRDQDKDAHRIKPMGPRERISCTQGEKTCLKERVAVKFAGEDVRQGWKMDARQAHTYGLDVQQTIDATTQLQIIVFDDQTHLCCTEKGSWVTERTKEGGRGKARRFKKLGFETVIPEVLREGEEKQEGKKKQKDKKESTCDNCLYTFQSVKGLKMHQRRACKKMEEMTISEMQSLRESRRNAKVARGTEDITAEKVVVQTCDGQKASACAHFTYLGSMINVKGTATMEIKRRIAKAFGVFGALTKVWSAKNITQETKAALYRAIILSVMLYNVEVMPMREHDLKALESAHFRLAKRMICRDAYVEHLSKQEVFGVTKLPRIAAYVTQKRLRWVGHALRREDIDRSKQAVITELKNKGSLWTKLVLRDCATIGVTMEKMILLSEDRAKFRRITFLGRCISFGG
jgi:hypothetical protein